MYEIEIVWPRFSKIPVLAFEDATMHIGWNRFLNASRWISSSKAIGFTSYPGSKTIFSQFQDALLRCILNWSENIKGRFSLDFEKSRLVA